MSQRQQHQSLPDLASTYRELYRARFRADVQADATTPFVVPLHLLAYWVVPTLYLAIPHRNRPWLYRARWLVLAFICAFNWRMVKDVASLNFASAYGAGLVAAWSTIWSFTLFVWTRPQWDAKRVERRARTQNIRNNQEFNKPSTIAENANLAKPGVNKLGDRPSTLIVQPNDVMSEPESNGATGVVENSESTTGVMQKTDRIRKRKPHGQQQPSAVGIMASTGDAESESEDKLLIQDMVSLNENDESARLESKTVLRFAKLAREQQHEYYWQEYPINASFWVRLDWAFDIVSSFRLTGWNWASSCLPPYAPPPMVGPYQLPLEYGIHKSKQGYERTVSRWTLIFSRWFVNVLLSYIILDICATLMTTDPYFIVGPEHNYPLPTHLISLHPIILSFQRTILAFIAIYSALQYVWNCGAVFLALYCPPILGFRAHPWHLPSMTGSFTQVLDRGLSGFWGAWWHQTFRVGFAAPTKWLLQHGYLQHPRSHRGNAAVITPLVGAIIAFAQSALIHAAGSYTSVPTTYRWGPPLFFAFSGLGTLLQTVASRSLRHRIEGLPRWVRRFGNLGFVVLWLWATSWMLLDDFGRSGIWLWEPVPISFARAAGLGADRRIWRYDRDSLPRWQWGPRGRWWQTGITI